MSDPATLTDAVQPETLSEKLERVLTAASGSIARDVEGADELRAAVAQLEAERDTWRRNCREATALATRWQGAYTRRDGEALAAAARIDLLLTSSRGAEVPRERLRSIASLLRWGRDAS